MHSLRGMTYIEVEVEGPHDDLHSGFYGGAVHNPALALVEILAKLHNPDHSIAVPGFYDDVVSLTETERAEIAKTAMSDEQLMEATGVPAVWGEEAFTIRERVSARPTLEINGLLSGWTGPGPKTIIPAKAMAKISCRLVGNQDPHKIYEQLTSYIESLAPPTVRVQVNLVTTGEPALIDFTLPEMQAAARAYEKGWGATPVFTRGGGSIPIVADICPPDEDPGGDDGVRPGHRRAARDQRALQHRDVPAGHRNGDRLPGGARATAALISHGITDRSLQRSSPWYCRGWHRRAVRIDRPPAAAGARAGAALRGARALRRHRRGRELGRLPRAGGCAARSVRDLRWWRRRARSTPSATLSTRSRS